MLSESGQSNDRRVTPFICSTDDFTEERKFLSTCVFPKLQELCRGRASCFQAYEWDHSLNEDRLKRGLALQLALKCITYASPYFIGFIGNQYGHHRPESSESLPSSLSELHPSSHWIEKNMLVAAENGFKWILDESYSHTSLLELKIIQAAFLSEETKFCRFYLRDKTALPTSGPFEKYKLQQLKANIAKRGLFVSYYNSLEELGNLVTTEWTFIIDQLYPPLLTKTIGTQQQIDAIHHRVFGEKRCERLVIHPGITKCFAELSDFSAHTNDYSYDPSIRAKLFEKSTGIRLLRKGRQQSNLEKAISAHESICVVTGARGCGKTSIVSNWLQNEAPGVVPPETVIIYHYATCNRMARNIAVFMKRCIAKLRSEFDSNYEDVISMESEHAEFSQIKETFVATLALGPCLIVFDGLDEIAATMGHTMIEMKQMEWLASPLPPTCKFIFTATDSDLSVKSLHKRKDVRFCPCPPIDSDVDKMEMLTEYISRLPNDNDLELSPTQASQITQYKLSSSPLYLNMIACELNDMQVGSDVDAHLDVYANIDSISNSTRDMWTSLIKRWVRDYSWTRYRDDGGVEPRSDRLEDTIICGWVPDCLRLLACSRDGLTMSELLGTLSFGLGYMGERSVSEYDWLLFHDAAKPALYEKPNGLIVINHEHLTEVIDFLLLGNISPPSLHETNTDFQHIQRMGGMERRQYHISLASHLLSKDADEQLVRIEEILWQLEISGDYTRLCNMLLIPLVMEKMYGSIYSTYTPLRVELIRFYKLLKAKNVDVIGKMRQKLSNLGFMDDKQGEAGQEDGELNAADVQSGAFTHRSLSELSSPTHRSSWKHGRPMTKGSVASDIIEDSATDFQSNAADSGSNDLDTGSRETTPATQSGRALSMTGSNRNELTSHDPSRYGISTSHSQSASNDTLQQPSGDKGTDDHHGEPTTEPDQDEMNQDMLISRSVSSAEVMKLALTCAKLIIAVDGSRKGGEILEQLTVWAGQKYPLEDDELFVLSHAYEALSSLSNDSQEFKIALDQLYKAHECLLDISVKYGEDNSPNYDETLLSFIKGKLKIEMSAICITSGDLILAQTFIDEARMTMEEIHCVPGTNYTQYNTALLREAQQNYLQATNYLHKCLDYFELRFGTLHPIVAEICHSLGKLLSDEENHETSDHAAAEEYLWKALNIRRERHVESLSTAESFFQLAFLIQKEGSKTRKREAMELLQNCIDIHTKKLGNDHQATKTVVYLLNDLEISLQLGQFEFGAAKPIDTRSPTSPFSQLSMHEKALVEYNQSVARKQRPASTQSSRSFTARPQSAFTVEKPRNESRLHQALVKRPKTAPTSFRRSASPLAVMSGLGDGEPGNVKVAVHEPYSPLSTAQSSPRTYRSCHKDLYSSIRPEGSHKQSVLLKYFPSDRHEPSYKSSKEVTTPNKRATSAPVKSHKCHNIGTHTIHEKLNTTTLGPNSTVISVADYTRPLKKSEPVHKAAWYHIPDHYATALKPHINARVYAQRKQRLMHQRSQSAPVRSRYLQDHTNAIRTIAQHESAYA